MELEVTKEEFQSYERVRKSGLYNMMMEAPFAAEAADLPNTRYWKVLKNYEACAEKWPDVLKD